MNALEIILLIQPPSNVMLAVVVLELVPVLLLKIRYITLFLENVNVLMDFICKEQLVSVVVILLLELSFQLLLKVEFVYVTQTKTSSGPQDLKYVNAQLYHFLYSIQISVLVSVKVTTTSVNKKNVNCVVSI